MGIVAARKQNIDICKVINHTFTAKERVKDTIELAHNYEKDPQKKERISNCECPVCFYMNSRVGGQMFCSAECAICGKVMNFPSTCTDLLCQDCAKEYNLCKHCGSDINLKQRRKLNINKEVESGE